MEEMTIDRRNRVVAECDPLCVEKTDEVEIARMLEQKDAEIMKLKGELGNAVADAILAGARCEGLRKVISNMAVEMYGEK